jgi:hypothetical protein
MLFKAKHAAPSLCNVTRPNEPCPSTVPCGGWASSTALSANAWSSPQEQRPQKGL